MANGAAAAGAADRGLDPKIIDRISGLELVARTIVEGFLAGSHRSPHRGSSIEFAQHRQYVPGDELRRVDWKVFARSDRLVVKEFIEETNLACHLLVDGSESMSYGSLAWNKLDYARWCAAGLAHLTLKRRDTAGLVIFDEEGRQKVAPGNGEAQLLAVLTTLDSAEAGGQTRIGGVLDWFASRLTRRGIVPIFSDFYDDLDSIVKGLERLVHDGHEPILFQIVDPVERSFAFEKLLRLDGLEDGGRRKVDPRALREAYLEEFNAHNERLARHARSLDVDYLLIDTSQPVDQVLSTYLAHRSAKVKTGGA